MAANDPRGKPELKEFLAGYGGPPPIEYRGGSVKLIAAIVYSDGIVIEWWAGPVPDLTWMPDIEPASGERFFPQFHDRPEELERMRRFKRLSTFWENASLTDDLGTQYQWAGGEAGGSEGVGYKGHEAFSPTVNVEARELTIRAHDLAITISLESGQSLGGRVAR